MTCCVYQMYTHETVPSFECIPGKYQAQPTIQVTVRLFFGVFKDTTDEFPPNACPCSFLTLDDIRRVILKRAVVCLYLLVSPLLRSAKRAPANVRRLNNISDVIFYCSVGERSRALALMNAALGPYSQSLR